MSTVPRFTPRARFAAFRAMQEANRYGRTQVDSEHFLLAIVSEPDMVAFQILRKMGVEADAVRQEVETHTDVVVELTQKPQLTPAASAAVDSAYLEANRLSDSYLSTGHLLIGLLWQNSGVAGIAMESLGVSLTEARHAFATLREISKVSSEGIPKDVWMSIFTGFEASSSRQMTVACLQKALCD